MGVNADSAVGACHAGGKTPAAMSARRCATRCATRNRSSSDQGSTLELVLDDARCQTRSMRSTFRPALRTRRQPPHLSMLRRSASAVGLSYAGAIAVRSGLMHYEPRIPGLQCDRDRQPILAISPTNSGDLAKSIWRGRQVGWHASWRSWRSQPKQNGTPVCVLLAGSRVVAA
jgi:hypothetical protein